MVNESLRYSMSANEFGQSKVKVAFYAPLKPPNHPVPSGDRLMARLLMQCLARIGLKVDVASTLRVFLRDAENNADLSAVQFDAQSEIERLSQQWGREGAPALWFCYHPYYKSPDLIGPALCQRFGIPYVTAEASYSNRRNVGIWEPVQAQLLTLINDAAVNICMTSRDKVGLQGAAPNASVVTLKPFIDIDNISGEVMAASSQPDVANLVTVAMMRRGDKMHSYEYLASALERLLDLPWTLSIVGDGALREEVQQQFSGIPATRIVWHGQLAQSDIQKIMSESALYVWPGCGEAYGLAYLEAQACALPVVAFRAAGVPEVVSDGFSGILTPEGDTSAYADAIAQLLTDENERSTMADNALRHVHSEHAVDHAVSTLRMLLRNYAGLKL